MTPALDFRDHLNLMAFTIVMEAGAEPYLGQLGVAWAIHNRPGSITDVIFQAYQFSAWNTKSPTRMNLDVVPTEQLRSCYKAACSAYYELSDDPTNGATHYLNPEAVSALPDWYDESKITARINRHVFLRLE